MSIEKTFIFLMSDLITIFHIITFMYLDTLSEKNSNTCVLIYTIWKYVECHIIQTNMAVMVFVYPLHKTILQYYRYYSDPLSLQNRGNSRKHWWQYIRHVVWHPLRTIHRVLPCIFIYIKCWKCIGHVHEVFHITN